MKRLVLVILAVVAAYLAVAPVAIDPQAWKAPPAPGYTGVHAVNSHLAEVQILSVAPRHGPEDVAVAADGTIFAGTGDGAILTWAVGAGEPTLYAETGGRPLGLAFDLEGRLLVADAYRGLLRFSPERDLTVLAEAAGGVPFGFTNNVDVALDGKIYFTDASSKFSARDAGDPYAASLLDLMEHGGHGRLLEYQPLSGEVEVLASGLHFANGVAVSYDGGSVLVNETANYRVLRVGREGAGRGRIEVLIDNLPGFPDNLTRGRDGRYWLGLVAPRNGLLDSLAPHPALRTVVQRLPAFLRPRAEEYSHLLAINDQGEVVLDLQDPAAGFPLITAGAESPTHVYLASLTAPGIARIAKTRLAPAGL